MHTGCFVLYMQEWQGLCQPLGWESSNNLGPRPRWIFLITLGGVPVAALAPALGVLLLLGLTQQQWYRKELLLCCAAGSHLIWAQTKSLWTFSSDLFLTELCWCHSKPWAFPAPYLDSRHRLCSQLCAFPGLKILNLGSLLWDWVSAVQLQYFGLSWYFELLLEKLMSWLWMSEMFLAAPTMGPAQVMPGVSGRAISPEIQPYFTPAIIPTTVMVSFSFPIGITRVRLCWCVLWSLPLYHGTSGARVCGMPTSLPPSYGTPSPSTSPGWSIVLPTCMATALTTSTSTPGRTLLSLWEPLVSAAALHTN